MRGLITNLIGKMKSSQIFRARRISGRQGRPSGDTLPNDLWVPRRSEEMELTTFKLIDKPINY